MIVILFMFFSLFVSSALTTNESISNLTGLQHVESGENRTECKDAKQLAKDEKTTQIGPINKKSNKNKWLTAALGTAGVLTGSAFLAFAMSGHSCGKSSSPISQPVPTSPAPVFVAPNPA